MDGKFEAFYLAMDKEGQLYVNRNPPFLKDTFNKSEQWELISRHQLENFEKQLHFIPARQNVLKR
jgi:hypothetical protein